MQQTLQRVKWRDLEKDFLLAWGRPEGRIESEHVSILGPTRSGKTYFETYVVQKRRELRGTNVMIIATKPADGTLKKTGWPIIRKYPPEYGKHEAFILWPQAVRHANEARAIQAQTIYEALTDIWHEDSNTIVVFDEIAYVEQELKLKVLIERYWREAASLGISVMATTQRPRNVTRYMWSEASWLVAFRPDDEDEAKRVAEILGGRRLYTETLLSLARHEFVIVNRREREAYISRIGT
jgi:DNA helicase HerA-like ATPase